MRDVSDDTQAERLLSVAEVGALLGVSRATIQRLVATRELRRIKIRRRALYRRSDVEALIARSTGSERRAHLTRQTGEEAAEQR
jgi:excisionase family DNA binding protein